MLHYVSLLTDRHLTEDKKHLKNVGPIRQVRAIYIAIHQVSLLSHAACASMSTTTTTTTTCDRGDRYGPIEWAQKVTAYMLLVICPQVLLPAACAQCKEPLLELLGVIVTTFLPPFFPSFSPSSLIFCPPLSFLSMSYFSSPSLPFCFFPGRTG